MGTALDSLVQDWRGQLTFLSVQSQSTAGGHNQPPPSSQINILSLAAVIFILDLLSFCWLP